MLRRRRIEPRRGGYTLVEVVIASLLASMMVTAVFSVALTAKAGGGRNDRKLLASNAARQVALQLRNYVTADEASTLIPGPGTGANSWSMTSGGVADSCGSCYALSPGTHILTGVFPAWFEAAPFNARVSYVVTYSQTLNGRPVPAVSVTANWDEPTQL